MTRSCQCALHDWGCMHDAVADNEGLCMHCNSDQTSEGATCSCACALCRITPGPSTKEWRCLCANHKGQLRCMLPAQNNGFCRNCDPFKHGECKCHCRQCIEAQHFAGIAGGADYSDIIESNRCACITADGVQCSREPILGREWCYDCSVGYCDCSCAQCITGEHQHKSGGTPDGSDTEVEQTERAAAKPLTPLKIRAAEL